MTVPENNWATKWHLSSRFTCGKVQIWRRQTGSYENSVSTKTSNEIATISHITARYLCEPNVNRQKGNAHQLLKISRNPPLILLTFKLIAFFRQTQ